ncbi:MAG: hypothetical protein E6X17_04355 [Sporomusaceae bacterium]|nr:hypothetical protein [Sporomusaceae bacterium]
MQITFPRLLALIAAITALIFTLLAGIFYQIPWLSLLWRITASAIFFLVTGYLGGIWLERHFSPAIAQALQESEEKGQNLDAVSEPEQKADGFDPFTPDSFDRISRS